MLTLDSHMVFTPSEFGLLLTTLPVYYVYAACRCRLASADSDATDIVVAYCLLRHATAMPLTPRYLYSCRLFRKATYAPAEVITLDAATPPCHVTPP